MSTFGDPGGQLEIERGEGTGCVDARSFELVEPTTKERLWSLEGEALSCMELVQGS